MKKRCPCRLCKRRKTLLNICTKLSESDRTLLMGIIEELESAEEMNDYYRAVLHNEWPGRHVIIVEEQR